MDDTKLMNFNILSFTQIGLEDPFPADEDLYDGSWDDIAPEVYKIPMKPTDLVYKRDRYFAEHSPLHIYIPRKEIMFKLMRACVAVQTPEELWFNKKGNL